MSNQKIATLFLDIGGVLLSNGWGREERKKAVTFFKLDADEINERHHLTYDTYESGKLSLEEYLNRIVFYEPRDFTMEEFKHFMMELSYAYQDVIDFFVAFKKRHKLKVVAVSNEGREMNAYRIAKFRLDDLFDIFVSSSFVHLRKPDVEIFHMACDLAHTQPSASIYIDDRLMFVQVAQSLGMHGLQFKGLNEIKVSLGAFDFENVHL